MCRDWDEEWKDQKVMREETRGTYRERSLSPAKELDLVKMGRIK